MIEDIATLIVLVLLVLGGAYGLYCMIVGAKVLFELYRRRR